MSQVSPAITVLMSASVSVLGLKRSHRAIRPNGTVDPLKSWNGFIVTNPETSVPVLSNSVLGEAMALRPTSRPSVRVSHSLPSVNLGSRRHRNTPDLVFGIDDPIGPICPAPPLTNVLATAPMYVQPVRAKVLSTLLSELL